MGYVPGDPTAGEPPAQLPPPLHTPPEGATVMRLSEWSYDRLLAEAATTQTSDPFADLLPDPPGTAPARLGHIAGQEPSRRRALAEAAEAGSEPEPAGGTAGGEGSAAGEAVAPT